MPASVLTRDALEGSPLADLHLIAAEIGLDGFRRLRKADLIDTILQRTGGDTRGADTQEEGTTDEDAGEKPKRPRRGARGGRTRRTRDADPGEQGEDEDAVAVEEPEVADAPQAPEAAQAPEAPEAEEAERPARSRARRGGRDRDRGPRNGERDGDRGNGARERDRDRDRDREEPGEARVAEGTVELLGNGSGFLRVSPPEPSDDDVYISAAQVRRCELVSGDTIAGPVRPPRRSERYPSLVRIDTINSRPADEVAEGTPFEELPSAFPTERFALGSDDPTLKAIEWLTPIGRGSRAVITGASRAGKTEALRRLAVALQAQDGLELDLVLVGVRPEEASNPPEGIEPSAALGLAASADAQAQAVDRAVDTARRIAARGGHAVVLIDTLDGLPPQAARKALAAARAIVDGGSLTVVATASAPLGGETTVIALDVALTSTNRLPAVDLVASGTLKPELLVGDAGADAIAQARASALGA
jgi:transcription termination factor Rho